MPAPKYQVLPGMPLTKGEQGRGLSLHIRLGWGLNAKTTGDGDRGLCGKLRKNSSTQALQNIVFSQHITLLLLHSLQGRSSQPLCFQLAGWGLAADFNLKPSPGDNVVSVAVLGHPPFIPHCLQRAQAKTQKPGNLPQDFTCHSASGVGRRPD